MSKKQETTGAIDPIANVFDGIKRTASTEVYQSTEIKKSLATLEVKTKTGVKYEIPPEVVKAHTLTVEFDFTGLTVDECVDQLVSTTSFMKAFQNNVIRNDKKRWSETKILDTVSKGIYYITCKKLLENQRQPADPMEAIIKAAPALKAKGMSNDQIIETILAQLNK